MDNPSPWAAEFADHQARSSSHWRKRQIWAIWLCASMVALAFLLSFVDWPYADLFRLAPYLLIGLGRSEYQRLGLLRGASEARERSPSETSQK